MLLPVLLCAAIGSNAISSNQGPTPQSKDKLRDEATPVQVGVITEKQRQHSKLYSSYTGNGDLQEIASNTPGDEVTIVSLPGIPELSPSGKPATSALDPLVEDADAVVIGVVSEKTSQLNEKRTFIFTDYEFTVEEVLKSVPNAQIEPNTSITVTNPGGRILLNGKTVTAIDRTFKPLEKGKKYLLFLKLIPATGAYQVFDNKSGFELDDKITVLTDAPVPVELRSGERVDPFLNHVKSSIAAYKNRKGGINK